ncbi:MAG TPA: DUF6599 family protein [Bryobacteraceae bacterium]|nr:DUF6599 family protein [Bryobacteraceae bacterium]
MLLDFDPLIAVANALATHTLYTGLICCLVILIPTLFFGRFFCGWMCPLGTLHHLVGNVRSSGKRGSRRIESNRYQGWQTFKYYLLVGLLAMASCGLALVGIVDPLSLFVRTLALTIHPAVNYATTAWLRLSIALHQPHFRQSVPLGLLFLTILVPNLRVTRFWCRALCPLGGLLGLVSRWSILGLEKRESACGDCRQCLLHCQGGDDPIPGAPWRKVECHLCMNCVADCPAGVLQFRIFPRTPTTRDGPGLKRRRLLTSLAAGTAAVPLLRANTGVTAEPDPRLIRPPGADAESDFLARCVHCGQCMKVCPNNALQPAFTEAGWEGIWTPVLAPRMGYCEPNCSLCGQVCPTGAIREFTTREKGWARADSTSPIRIGTAFYDRGRCLPWAMATECIVCEEWCPTSPKAIYLKPADVADAAGGTVAVRQPYLDPRRCVGCGACEFACPVKGSPGIYVTSVGESRSKTNQLLLGNAANRPSWLPESNEAAGWSKTGEARQYEAGDLWRYVDGDAERYLRAGVRRTITGTYRYRDVLEAVVDLHWMRTAAGAASIFESEPAAGSRPVALGDAGRSYGQTVTFRHDCFFVRLVAYQDLPQTEQALLNLGRAVDSKLEKP